MKKLTGRNRLLAIIMGILIGVVVLFFIGNVIYWSIRINSCNKKLEECHKFTYAKILKVTKDNTDSYSYTVKYVFTALNDTIKTTTTVGKAEVNKYYKIKYSCKDPKCHEFLWSDEPYNLSDINNKSEIYI
jgi:hypothetical protein